MLKLKMFDPKPILSQLPNLPGVYRMKNAAGEVIYVGKARELKKRVSSYFRTNHPSPRTTAMVSHIAAIETTVTRSESEALLLESNLIKGLNPRYNVLFRDDKSYPYIMITGDEFAQIRFYRGNHIKPHRFYGPFPSTWAVRETIQHLQKVFRLRTCDDSVFNHRSRPCLLHQIGRCSAPCAGLISRDAYARDIGHAEMFLQGKESEVLDDISRKMEAASKRLDFEEAATYRDQTRLLQAVLARQFVDSASQCDADVICVVEKSSAWCVNLVMIRSGRHLGDKSLFPQNTQGADQGTILDAFIGQHYAAQLPPPRIIVETDIGVSEWEATLSEAGGRAVRIVSHATGEARGWLVMAKKNATLALEQRLASQASQEERLAALNDALGLSGVARIECFDISHTMGEATVASCVVYDQGAMQSMQYRRFNIAGITPGDDYAAMKEALSRRYRKLAEGDETAAKRPDLILIDGGKGQLGVAEAALSELGLSDIAMIGVAKGEERKPGLEQLIFSGGEKVLQLPKDHPGLHLIQQIRDEAHRFAITGHRNRRAKARTTSRLEGIRDVGPRRRQTLLKHFGGIQGILDASVDDLEKVAGISRKLAETIYNELH